MRVQQILSILQLGTVLGTKSLSTKRTYRALILKEFTHPNRKERHQAFKYAEQLNENYVEKAVTTAVLATSRLI